MAAVPFGKGNLILTGQLGDVMKESAQIALSLARSMAPEFGKAAFDFTTQDLHIHVPSGATPKDGPSAGITLLTALVSLILNQPVEKTLGMTGEITLRGAILPVGGIKEKILAAHRAGITHVILPKKNEQELAQVPLEISRQIHFTLVDTVEEVLNALFNQPRPEALTREVA